MSYTSGCWVMRFGMQGSVPHVCESSIPLSVQRPGSTFLFWQTSRTPNRTWVEKVVESLHAVLFVSPEDGNVYWYHASFPDFVFSRARARNIPLRHQNYPTHHVIDVFCDASTHHGVLARRCFSAMQSLHFNMCNLLSSYVLDSEVPGLKISINKAFSTTLRYASRHWAGHLLRAMAPKNETDDLVCALKDFLCDKLLFWIETTSGHFSQCTFRERNSLISWGN